MRVRALVFNMTGYLGLFRASHKDYFSPRWTKKSTFVDIFGRIGQISVRAASNSSSSVDLALDRLERRELANGIQEAVVAFRELRLVLGNDIRGLKVRINRLNRLQRIRGHDGGCLGSRIHPRKTRHDTGGLRTHGRRNDGIHASLSQLGPRRL